jgi:NAD(P)-dependent dehydrogenase (short-subunit alcohol dehydrogenase family)
VNAGRTRLGRAAAFWYRSRVRTVIVGGSSSLGRDVVEAFAARGDDVLSTWTTHEPAPRAGVQTRRLDLRDDADLQAFAAFVAAGAPVDALLVLSGVLPGRALADYTPALLHEVFEVNTLGPARLVQLLLPCFAPGAQVLLAASISGRFGSFDPVYAASKAALEGLTKSLASWLGPRVRCNAVAPSLIEGSTMYDAMAPDRRAHHVAASPTGALLQSADLARILRDLTEPHWRHLDGAVLDLNGGRRP